jgi:hypothetical protein
VQWGGEVKSPGSGGAGVQRFCTLNLWALDDNGQVWVLAYDYTRPFGDPPIFMRWPDAQSA